MKTPPRSLRKKFVLKFAPKLSATLTMNKYVKTWLVPRDLDSGRETPFVPTQRLGHDGIDMRVPEQIERLERWRSSYLPVFKALREDPAVNTWYPGRDYLHNGGYPTPDAEVYAAMILDYRPRNIIEIGGGFSTIIARKMITQLGAECGLLVIDPEPRTDIEEVADSILYSLVEDVDPSRLPLGERTLVFVDSSHVTRPGGDIPFLYNRLLPALPSGTLVHVHDVYIPYEYPWDCRKWLFSEQYVLQALLAHSPRHRVALATHFLTREHPGPMRATFGDIVGRDDLHYGSSLWFEVV